MYVLGKDIFTTDHVPDEQVLTKILFNTACSRDGSARLWDCGTASCLGVLAECSRPINACAVETVNEEISMGSREEEMSK